MSDSPAALVVYPSKPRLILFGTGALLIAALCVAIPCYEVELVLWKRAFLLLIGAPLFALGAVFWLHRLIRPRPLVVVDERGVTDHSSAVSFGLIAWSELQRAYVYQHSGTAYLAIVPKDEAVVLARLGWPKRATLWVVRRLTGVTFNIMGNALPIAIDEVLSRIEQFQAAQRERELWSGHSTAGPSRSPIALPDAFSKSTPDHTKDSMSTATKLAAATPAAAPPVKQVPRRCDVLDADRWDLASLYLSDEAWEADLVRFEADIAKIEQFQGRLGESAAVLAECLRFDSVCDRLAERLGVYAHLKSAEDTANGTYQRMQGRFMNVVSRAAQAASYIRPEIMAIDDARMRGFLASPELTLYRLKLQRLLRYKPHTLSEKEEKLLAMQSEMSETAGMVFRQLNNADLKFGAVANERGETIELSHGTFSTLLHSPDRVVRERAFRQYYQQFKAHENTLAATLNGSVQRDIYYAKARGYESALAGSLFHDDVPTSVYDNLIATVRKHLPSVHRFYDLRRRLMKLPDIHHYDTYVPILAQMSTRRTWDQAVELVIRSLEPLGSDYCGTLEKGLRGRWCDRYENQGKQSGAFSSGSYDGDPYILMNYQEQVLDHVFTLAHEAGHSMHSWHSAKHQPFEYYDYTIFVAEVASTFNEELLSHHMLEHARDDKERAYLINREIDDIRATLVRQTMFAEFEKTTHAMAEAGEPLTKDSFQKVYRELLEAYFGPDFAIDEELSLECFRIPHFYRAFYVYKYATGLSAAIALSQRVLNGGPRELNDYLGFLKAGCSKFPLDILRDAGVDMSQPEPVDTALRYFDRLVTELDGLLS